MYAVKRSGGRLFLNTDNARFINHSKNPNTKSLGAEKNNIAIRNIKPGEEITIDYEQIEQGPIDFEVK
jgi:SET domain-containing protein